MAMTTAQETVCPGCSKPFRLRPEAAGKKIKCHCGCVFTAPPLVSTEGIAAISDEDLLPVEATEPTRDSIPPVRPMPPAALPRSLSPVAQALLAREDDSHDSPLREFWVPLAVLLIGAILHPVLWSLWIDSTSAVLITAAVTVAVQLLIFIPVMFSSLAMGAKWLDISPGPFRPVLWKMIALTLGPAAMADVLFTATLIIANFDWELIAAGFGFYLVLMGISASIVFELNVAQTAFFVLINFVARIIIAYPAAVVLNNLNWIN